MGNLTSRAATHKLGPEPIMGSMSFAIVLMRIRLDGFLQPVDMRPFARVPIHLPLRPKVAAKGEHTALGTCHDTEPAFFLRGSTHLLSKRVNRSVRTRT